MFYLSTFIFECSIVITEYDHAGIKWLQIKCVQNEKSAYLQMQSKTFMSHTRHFWILNNRNVKLVVGEYWRSATRPNPSVCSWASCDMIIKACSAVGNKCFEISSFVINTILNAPCTYLDPAQLCYCFQVTTLVSSNGVTHYQVEVERWMFFARELIDV